MQSEGRTRRTQRRQAPRCSLSRASARRYRRHPLASATTPTRRQPLRGADSNATGSAKDRRTGTSEAVGEAKRMPRQRGSRRRRSPRKNRRRPGGSLCGGPLSFKGERSRHQLFKPVCAPSQRGALHSQIGRGWWCRRARGWWGSGSRVWACVGARRAFTPGVLPASGTAARKGQGKPSGTTRSLNRLFSKLSDAHRDSAARSLPGGSVQMRRGTPSLQRTRGDTTPRGNCHAFDSPWSTLLRQRQPEQAVTPLSLGGCPYAFADEPPSPPRSLALSDSGDAGPA
jgi:hypothetical protein